MFIIKYQKFFIGLSTFFVAISLFFVFFFGLNLGIDFKGGSQLSISYTEARPEISVIKTALEKVGYSSALVQPTGDKGIIIKDRDLSEADKSKIISNLSENGKIKVTEESFTTIGPSVGKELKNKAIVSIVLVLIAIICFVAYAFRQVSKPVSSWKYGLAVIIALVHDIIIPTGAFALIGHFYGTELDTLFVVALLTTLAISISDSIVVFDRVRENLRTSSGKSFEQVVGESISQTFARSINTSLTTLAMAVVLAVVGPHSTKIFATILAIGLFFGTYSSIFLASPLLVLMEKLQKKN
jgi:preprotein translocase subunit SecF